MPSGASIPHIAIYYNSQVQLMRQSSNFHPSPQGLS